MTGFGSLGGLVVSRLYPEGEMPGEFYSGVRAQAGRVFALAFETITASEFPDYLFVRLQRRMS